MRLDLLFRSRGALAAVSAITLGAGIFMFRANADEWDKKTVLTINETTQVRDTVLDPGQYVFKLLDSQSDRHVVQIFNADQSRIIGTILAIPKEKMEPAEHSEFTFWETPPGAARAMRAWFYPGDLIGQEFPYPKHLKQIAMVTTAEVIPAPPIIPETVTVAPPMEPQPQQQQAEEQPVPVQQPTEMAESTPPQEPAAAPTPEPAPSAPPAELPKTASPYPLIGLSGLALLGLSGLLKLRRAS